MLNVFMGCLSKEINFIGYDGKPVKLEIGTEVVIDRRENDMTLCIVPGEEYVFDILPYEYTILQ